MNREETNIMDSIRKNWVIFMFFLGLAVTWGTMLAKISSIEVRLDKVEEQSSLTATSIQSVRDSQARVETKLEFLIDR